MYLSNEQHQETADTSLNRLDKQTFISENGGLKLKKLFYLKMNQLLHQSTQQQISITAFQIKICLLYKLAFMFHLISLFPTMFDFLSCNKDSLRIYIPKQKVCVCPHNIDEEICKTYDKYTTGCQYGYFENEGDCFKFSSVILYFSPPKIRDNVLNCLQSLNNPKGQQNKPICFYDLYIDNQGSTQQLIYSPSSYFLFMGTKITLCLFCYETNFSNVEDQFSDYFYNNLKFKSFCQNSDDNYFQFYEYSLPSCTQCYLSIKENQCLQYIYSHQLINGECKPISEIDISWIFFTSPSHVTSKKKCQLCPVSNCKY